MPGLHFQSGRGAGSRGKGGRTGQARAFGRPGDGWGRRERKWEVRGGEGRGDFLLLGPEQSHLFFLHLRL